MRLTFLAILLFNLCSFSQTAPIRSIQNPLSYYYNPGVSPFVKTADGGYLFNCSGVFWTPDGGDSFENALIKTDSAFVPQWTKTTHGKNGRASFLLGGGNIFSYGAGGIVELFCFAPDGQLLWSTRNSLPYFRGIMINDALIEGSVVTLAGKSYHPYNYSSNGFFIHYDTAGTCVGADSLVLAGLTSVDVLRMVKDPSGSYCFAGEARNGGSEVHFVAKKDEFDEISWALKIDQAPYSLGNDVSLCSHSNGDFYFAADYANQTLSSAPYYNASVHLMRIGIEGNVLWTKTFDEIGSVSDLKELPNGHLMLCGDVKDPSSYLRRGFLMELDENGNVVWGKRYYRIYSALNSPFVESPNNLYMIYVSEQSDLNIVNMDSLGNTSCSTINFHPDFHDAELTVTAVEAHLFPALVTSVDTFHPGAYNTTPPNTDTCIYYPTDTVAATICRHSDYLFADSTLAENVLTAISHTSILSGQAANGLDSVIMEFIDVFDISMEVQFSGDTLVAEQSSATYQWIDCLTNTAIVGATNQAFFPLQGGSYAVEITTGSCVDTSACISVGFASLSDSNPSFVRVYPNPTNGNQVFISNESGLIADFRLFTLEGVLVFVSDGIDQSREILLPPLTDGLYLYTIQTVTGASSGKLVVNTK